MSTSNTPTASPKPETHIYKKGDIVWAKLGSSWWPGEVKNQDELPTDLNSDFKRPPLVIVQFFDEDSYEYIKNWAHIYPYNCDKKVDFIRKGMAAFRNKSAHMEKFPKDVTQAEERTGGNPNILSDPVFLPQKKFNYSELFGTPSPNPKKLKSGTTTRKSYNKSSAPITHRRFIGHDDYKAIICVQYPGKFRLCEEENVYNDDEGQSMECKSCGFNTKRLSVMIIHSKMHLSSSNKKKFKPARKKKEIKKKDIFSDLLDEWSDDDQDETKENNSEVKDSAEDKALSEKNTPRTYSKKSKKQFLEEKTWEDSDLADFLKKDSANNKESPKNKDKSEVLKSASVTQEDIKNCFDFDEDEEEDIVLSTGPGRKIPRVIPEKNRSPRTEELEHTLEDDNPDINRDEILRTSQSFNKSTDDKSTDNLEDIFKEVMEETSIPQVEKLLNNFKPEQNFHDGHTVKKPDKCGPSESDTGKKRFVKSFEDFEIQIHQKSGILDDIGQGDTSTEESPQKSKKSPKKEEFSEEKLDKMEEEDSKDTRHNKKYQYTEIGATISARISDKTKTKLTQKSKAKKPLKRWDVLTKLDKEPEVKKENKHVEDSKEMPVKETEDILNKQDQEDDKEESKRLTRGRKSVSKVEKKTDLNKEDSSHPPAEKSTPRRSTRHTVEPLEEPKQIPDEKPFENSSGGQIQKVESPDVEQNSANLDQSDSDIEITLKLANTSMQTSKSAVEESPESRRSTRHKQIEKDTPRRSRSRSIEVKTNKEESSTLKRKNKEKEAIEKAEDKKNRSRKLSEKQSEVEVEMKEKEDDITKKEDKNSKRNTGHVEVPEDIVSSPLEDKSPVLLEEKKSRRHTKHFEKESLDEKIEEKPVKRHTRHNEKDETTHSESNVTSDALVIDKTALDDEIEGNVTVETSNERVESQEESPKRKRGRPRLLVKDEVLNSESDASLIDKTTIPQKDEIEIITKRSEKSELDIVSDASPIDKSALAEQDLSKAEPGSNSTVETSLERVESHEERPKLTEKRQRGRSRHSEKDEAVKEEQASAKTEPELNSTVETPLKTVESHEEPAKLIEKRKRGRPRVLKTDETLYSESDVSLVDETVKDEQAIGKTEPELNSAVETPLKTVESHEEPAKLTEKRKRGRPRVLKTDETLYSESDVSLVDETVKDEQAIGKTEPERNSNVETPLKTVESREEPPKLTEKRKRGRSRHLEKDEGVKDEQAIAKTEPELNSTVETPLKTVESHEEPPKLTEKRKRGRPRLLKTDETLYSESDVFLIDETVKDEQAIAKTEPELNSTVETPLKAVESHEEPLKLTEKRKRGRPRLLKTDETLYSESDVFLVDETVKDEQAIAKTEPELNSNVETPLKTVESREEPPKLTEKGKRSRPRVSKIDEALHSESNVYYVNKILVDDIKTESNITSTVETLIEKVEPQETVETSVDSVEPPTLTEKRKSGQKKLSERSEANVVSNVSLVDETAKEEEGRKEDTTSVESVEFLDGLPKLTEKRKRGRQRLSVKDDALNSESDTSLIDKATIVDQEIAQKDENELISPSESVEAQEVLPNLSEKRKPGRPKLSKHPKADKLHSEAAACDTDKTTIADQDIAQKVEKEISATVETPNQIIESPQMTEKRKRGRPRVSEVPKIVIEPAQELETADLLVTKHTKSIEDASIVAVKVSTTEIEVPTTASDSSHIEINSLQSKATEDEVSEAKTDENKSKRKNKKSESEDVSKTVEIESKKSRRTTRHSDKETNLSEQLLPTEVEKTDESKPLKMDENKSISKNKNSETLEKHADIEHKQSCRSTRHLEKELPHTQVEIEVVEVSSKVPVDQQLESTETNLQTTENKLQKEETDSHENKSKRKNKKSESEDVFVEKQSRRSARHSEKETTETPLEIKSTEKVVQVSTEIAVYQDFKHVTELKSKPLEIETNTELISHTFEFKTDSQLIQSEEKNLSEPQLLVKETSEQNPEIVAENRSKRKNKKSESEPSEMQPIQVCPVIVPQLKKNEGTTNQTEHKEKLEIESEEPKRQHEIQVETEPEKKPEVSKEKPHSRRKSKHTELVQNEQLEFESASQKSKDKRPSRRDSSSAEGRKKKGRKEEPKIEPQITLRERRTRTTYSEEDKILQRVLKESAEEAKRAEALKSKNTEEPETPKTKDKKEKKELLKDSPEKSEGGRELRRRTTKVSEEDRILEKVLRESAEEARMQAEQRAKEEAALANKPEIDTSAVLRETITKPTESPPKKRGRKSRWDSGPSESLSKSPDKAKGITLGVVIDSKQKTSPTSDGQEIVPVEVSKQEIVEVGVETDKPQKSESIEAFKETISMTKIDSESDKAEVILPSSEKPILPSSEPILKVSESSVDVGIKISEEISIELPLSTPKNEDKTKSSEDIIMETIEKSEEISIELPLSTPKNKEQQSKEILKDIPIELPVNAPKTEESQPEEISKDILIPDVPKKEGSTHPSIYDFTFDVSEIPLPPGSPKAPTIKPFKIASQAILSQVQLPETSTSLSPLKSETKAPILFKKGRWSRRNSHPKKDKKLIEEVTQVKDVPVELNQEEIKEGTSSFENNEIILPLKKSRRVTETNSLLEDDFSFKEEDTSTTLQKNINDALNFLIEDTASPIRKFTPTSKNLDDFAMSTDVVIQTEVVVASSEISEEKPSDLSMPSEEGVKKLCDSQKGVPPKKKKHEMPLDLEVEKDTTSMHKQEVPQPPKKKLQKFYENSLVLEKSWTNDTSLMSPLAKKKSFAFQEEHFEADRVQINENVDLPAGKIDALDDSQVSLPKKPKMEDTEQKNEEKSLDQGEAVASMVKPVEIVPKNAIVEELVIEEHKVELSQHKTEEMVSREAVSEHIETENQKIDSLETSIQEIIPQEAKVEEIVVKNLETKVPESVEVSKSLFEAKLDETTKKPTDEVKLLYKEKKVSESDKPKATVAVVKEDVTKNVETHHLVFKTKEVVDKPKPETVKNLVKEKILTKSNESPSVGPSKESKVLHRPKTEVIKDLAKGKLVIKVTESKSSRRIIKPIVSLKPEPLKVDKLSPKIEEEKLVMGTKPDVIPDPTTDAELVEIEENLIQTISQKELADAQVTITPEQVISEKKPTGLGNLLTMADFSESSNSSVEMPDKKTERGTEFTIKAMTKALDKKTTVSKANTYGRLELLDILEGNSNSNSSTGSNEQFKKSFDKHEVTAVEGIQDFEESIPCSAIVLAKKDVTSQLAESATIRESPKLLERLSQPQKVVIQSDIKVKEAGKLLKQIPVAKTTQPHPKIVIKTKPQPVSTAKSPSRRPIILSEQIIRPATIPSAVNPPAPQSTVSALKRPFEDIEDVEPPFLITKTARIDFPEVPDEPVREFKGRKSKGKAKILQHSIIAPQVGKLYQKLPTTQPSLTQPQLAAPQHVLLTTQSHLATTKPQLAVAKPPVATAKPPLATIKPLLATTQAEDAMFDINSMPIVLSDELLTPESIEKMPVVISSEVIGGTSGTQKSGTIPMVKEKLVPKLPPKKAVVAGITPKTQLPTASNLVVPDKSKSKVLSGTAPTLSKLPVAGGLLTTPGSKSAKFLLVPSTAASQAQQKIVAAAGMKQQSLQMTKPKSALPSLQVSNPIGQSGVVTTDPTNGSKIMIVTNQQGEAHRLLLTPAQQKMLGMHGQGVKDPKTIVKGSAVPKNLLTEASPSTSGLATLSSLSPTSPILQQPPHKVLTPLTTSQAHITTTTTTTQQNQLSQTPRTQNSGTAITGGAAIPGGTVIPGTGIPMARQQSGAKTIQGGARRYQAKNSGKQKTILIKNQLGQTVKKIQGTDDEELDRQVAEQLAAIKASAMLQAQETAQRKTAVPTSPKTPGIKPTPKRTPPKKTEDLKPPKITQQPSSQLAQKLLEGVTTSTSASRISSLTNVQKSQPTKKLLFETKPTTLQTIKQEPISIKQEPVSATTNQTAPHEMATLVKADPAEQTGGKVAASAAVGGDGKKPDRPLQQLVIQDAMGNQTTITEGQILALPSETVDGQPQSYMLITLDESGNLTPLNNEALMSLDPSLGLGGDISNMVLQVDQGQGVLASASAVANKTDVAAAPIITDQQKVAERIKGPVIEPKELNKPDVQKPQLAKPVHKPETVQKPIDTVSTPPQSLATAPQPETLLPELHVSLGDPPGGDPTQGQQLIVTGDPNITQKFLESLSDGSTDLAGILAADTGSLLIQIDGQQILIRTNSQPDNAALIPSESSSEGSGNPIFSPQHKPNQDILAAALANTDVFQGQDSPTSGINKEGLLPPGADLSLNAAGGTLYPMHVGNVLETSLTLSSPIMTPLEAPSLPSKKIVDEADILHQVPKNVDLPITITDPNISQTVAHPPAGLLELTLPLTDMPISSPMSYTTSPRAPKEEPKDVKPLNLSTESTQKSFNGNMPLLTDEVSEDSETKIRRESTTSFNVLVGETKEDLTMTETTTSSTDSLLDAGLCTLGGAMCSSLSEPPPDMFELPEKEEEISSDQSNSVPEAETLSLNSDGSGEIPLQPSIVAKLSDMKRHHGESGGDTGDAKRAKFD